MRIYRFEHHGNPVKKAKGNVTLRKAKGWCPYSTEKRSQSLNVAVRPKFQTNNSLNIQIRKKLKVIFGSLKHK